MNATPIIRLATGLLAAAALVALAAAPSWAQPCTEYAEHPRCISYLDTPDHAWDVVFDGTLAFVADRYTGILAVDLSDPSAPVVLDAENTPGDATRLALDGDYLYVADGSLWGLTVMDVSDPANLSIVANIYTPGESWDIVIEGDLAYLADGPGGLCIVDISNPAAPVVVGQEDTAGFSRGIAVSGGRAYLADFAGGLIVMDVTNAANPVILGSLDTPGMPSASSSKGTWPMWATTAAGFRSSMSPTLQR